MRKKVKVNYRLACFKSRTGLRLRSFENTNDGEAGAATEVEAGAEAGGEIGSEADLEAGAEVDAGWGTEASTEANEDTKPEAGTEAFPLRVTRRFSL